MSRSGHHFPDHKCVRLAYENLLHSSKLVVFLVDQFAFSIAVANGNSYYYERLPSGFLVQCLHRSQRHAKALACLICNPALKCNARMACSYKGHNSDDLFTPSNEYETTCKYHEHVDGTSEDELCEHRWRAIMSAIDELYDVECPSEEDDE